jgi:hypothetical protein
LDDGPFRRNAVTYAQDGINTEYIHTGIHSSRGIRTHDRNVRAEEDTSCLSLRGYCDQHVAIYSCGRELCLSYIDTERLW